MFLYCQLDDKITWKHKKTCPLKILFEMLVVAVAGGTGDVGRTIVEELRRVAKFKIVLLTRGVSTRYLEVCIHVIDC